MTNRTQFLGGSDVAALLGLSPYTTPYALWAEKTGRTDPPDLSSKGAVLWGQVLEPVIAEYWARINGGIFLGQRLRRRFHPAFPFMSAEVDYYVYSMGPPPQRPDAILEIKTAGDRMRGKWGDEHTDQVPPEYYVQALWQLLINPEIPKVIIAVLIGGQDFREYVVRREDAHGEIAALEEAARQWWERHVINDVPPPIESTDRSVVDQVFELFDPEKAIVARKADETLIRRITRNKARVKAIETELDRDTARLCARIGHNEVIVDSENRVLASWKGQRRRSLDWNAIADEAEVPLAVIEKHQTSKTIRVLRTPAPRDGG